MGPDEYRVVARPWAGDGGVSAPVRAIGMSLIASGCLRGATPRGQPWPSVGTLLQGRHGLRVRRMAVLATWRAWRDLPLEYLQLRAIKDMTSRDTVGRACR